MSKKNRDMAVFRYGVICPLRCGNDGRSLRKRLIEQADKIWTLPDGRLRQFRPATIEEWFYLYRRRGLSALEQNPRKDKGRFRGIPEDVREYLDILLKDHPKLKTSAIIRCMADDNVIVNGYPSNSTIYRYLRSVRPIHLSANKKERRSFEVPYAGSLWQADIMYGPHLPKLNARGKWTRQQTYLVAIIDDHSRLLCHGEFFFQQDILAWLSCLKTALKKRGIPERIYCDNGQVFRSDHIRKIMARLGSAIIFTKIRDCEAKGKIERFFLTVRNSFLDPLMALDKPKDINELNQKFWRWSEDHYNHKKHSAINSMPIEKWMLTSHKVRLFNSTNEHDFYFDTTRKVKKDGTISLHGKIYETSSTLVGKKVRVSYDPFMPERPFIYYENQSYGMATALNKDFNSRMPGRKEHK